jgi:glutamate 5-kinase
VRSSGGVDIARGLANYSSAEARLIARKASSQIESLLGYSNEPEMIHRTNLVLV